MERYLLILLNSSRNKLLIDKLLELNYSFDTIYYQHIKTTKLDTSIYSGLMIGGDWSYHLTNLKEALTDKYLVEIYKLYNCFSTKIVIGICFGCQLLAVFNDCVIGLAPTKYIVIMDNIILDKRYKLFTGLYRLSNIILDKRYKLFTGLSKIESFCRNHERMIQIPSTNINILAKTQDDIIMVISIKNNKHYGILFHPEYSNNGNIIFNNINNL